MVKTGVLFDIDGTLCDTNYLHAVAWSRAIREIGEYAHTSTLHHLIGMGSEHLLQEALGHESKEATKAYERNFAAFKGDIRAFPGAADLLRATKALGAQVVLASSAQPELLKELRKAIDADDVIDAATSAGDVDASKPAPDIFTTAMDEAGLTADRCIVVGDTVWDVQAARKAGLECICVLTGGIDAPTLREAGAVAVYMDPMDLLENLKDSPIGKLCA